jgi:hypothetical protein
MFHDPDLREPAGEGRWSLDVGRERLDTCGQGRVAGLGLDARPAARRIASDGGFEIVAKRGGKRALIARRGLDLMERAIARAAAFDCPEQRLCLGFEGAERGARGGDLAFGRSRAAAATARSASACVSAAPAAASRASATSRLARAALRASTSGASSPKFGYLRLQPGGFRGGHAGVCSGQFQRVRGDARFGQFGGLHGARAAERRLRLARRVLPAGRCGCRSSARDAFGLSQTLSDRIPPPIGSRASAACASWPSAASRAAVGEEGGR